jgi:large subunit ribosomal protein L3
MMKTILGRKLHMSQVFLDNGDCMPVTVVKAGPCIVTQRKTLATDKYEAVQLGLDPFQNANKPMTGHFKKNNLQPTKVLREVRVDADEKLAVGNEVKVDIFAEGDLVDVIGLTKGRGFAGGMKRWGWMGGPGSHGSMSHRRIGSVGSNTYPGRPWRGRTLPGRYGNERVTIRNLKVVKVEPEANLLYVYGAVPGAAQGVVLVRKVKDAPVPKAVPEKPAKGGKK